MTEKTLKKKPKKSKPLDYIPFEDADKPRKRKRYPSQWVELKAVKKWQEVQIIVHLRQMAVAFATHPDRVWTSQEIVEYLHNQMAKRKKFGQLQGTDEDDLPHGHVKLMY